MPGKVKMTLILIFLNGCVVVSDISLTGRFAFPNDLLYVSTALPSTWSTGR